jgi:hypothetical protein
MVSRFRSRCSREESRHVLTYPYKGRLKAIPIKSKDAGVKFVQPPPLSQELQPEVLDRLTVADDQTFLDRLREELNLPDYVKAGLSELF